ncbi:hypothetical protein [Amycolatopsis camponoti]|uniref:hypothetical protein n=1 Tax=Amycolatopsis camponoti TaxID=2606593 RepID=UPI0012D7C94B|nr:hypothetical protein [Amycolatopsis camponoti]
MTGRPPAAKGSDMEAGSGKIGRNPNLRSRTMNARLLQAVIGTAFVAALVFAPAAQAAEKPPQTGPSIGVGPYIGDSPRPGTASADTK